MKDTKKQEKKQEKQKKRLEKKSFRQAMDMELREHKSSFLVFAILRVLVGVALVRQCFLHNYESVFLCAMTILLLYVPSWVQVKLRIELPPALEITVLCFIFAAEILGELNAFYIVVPFWDTILHTLNGFLCAAVGFSLVVLLNDNEKLTFDLSPFYMAMASFCFSMTVGVLWELFECFMDLTFHTDMQKDTVIHNLYTVALDPTNSNKVVGITGITDTTVNGESLGLGGYLDIGLLDTMKDLFVNFIGAVVFSVTGFFYAKSKGRKKTAAQSFVPRKKAESRDYLKLAREENGAAFPGKSPEPGAAEERVFESGTEPAAGAKEAPQPDGAQTAERAGALPVDAAPESE